MIVAAILILLIGIWAISSALGSGKKNDNNKPAETAKTEEKNKDKEKQTGTSPVSPADQYNPSAQAPEVKEQPAETPAPAPAPVVNNDIPSTGPSEIVFSALMLGVVVYLVTLNIQLVKKEQ